MSRSYKKTPVIKFAPSKGKIGKGFANRRVRKYKGDLSDGACYKRLYEPWNIHDCVMRYTLDDAMNYRTKALAYNEMRGWDDSPEEANINLCIWKWKKSFRCK
jgi:hypothetical protein